MLGKINSFINSIIKHEDFRVRLFSILAIVGTAVCPIMIFTRITIISIENVIINIILMFLSAGLLAYSRKTGNYQICYLITIVGIFLIAFPMLFFASGGYHGGVPSFFIFAIVFTALMLDSGVARIIIPIELFVYGGLCVFAFFFPDTVTQVATEKEALLDVLAGLMTSGIACGICIYLHLREYEIQQIKLSQQNEQLHKYNEAKTTFLTTVAHEIKNPLTAISVNAHDSMELIDEMPLDKDLIRGNMKTIERVVLRIDRILVDLMDTASIEQGRLVLKLIPIELYEVLQEAVSTLASDISAKNNKIEWNIKKLPVITADYARLLQVIINLISNSIKHTKNGTITLSLDCDDEFQIVTISDTGAGMPEKIRKDAFKGYVSISEDYWRHGIGLYVCHQIVTAHGGHIKLESELGKGTSVSFNLPIYQNI